MNTVKWSAIGIGTKNQEGNWLEILYPKELILFEPDLDVLFTMKSPHEPSPGILFAMFISGEGAPDPLFTMSKPHRALPK